MIFYEFICLVALKRAVGLDLLMLCGAQNLKLKSLQRPQSLIVAGTDGSFGISFSILAWQLEHSTTPTSVCSAGGHR